MLTEFINIQKLIFSKSLTNPEIGIQNGKGKKYHPLINACAIIILISCGGLLGGSNTFPILFFFLFTSYFHVFMDLPDTLAKMRLLPIRNSSLSLGYILTYFVNSFLSLAAIGGIGLIIFLIASLFKSAFPSIDTQDFILSVKELLVAFLIGFLLFLLFFVVKFLRNRVWKLAVIIFFAAVFGCSALLNNLTSSKCEESNSSILTDLISDHFALLLLSLILASVVFGAVAHRVILRQMTANRS